MLPLNITMPAVKRDLAQMFFGAAASAVSSATECRSCIKISIAFVPMMLTLHTPDTAQRYSSLQDVLGQICVP